MKNRKRILTWFRFCGGIFLLFLFTQIQWAEYFFPIKKIENEEIDNTALFYTESEAAGKTELFLKKK